MNSNFDNFKFFTFLIDKKLILNISNIIINIV